MLARCAALPRVQADPSMFRRATRGLKRGLCNRLLAETYEAARHRDSYAFVSLSRAVVATPAALMHALLSPETWRKLRVRARSGRMPA